ncbi:MAG: hypothetical protein HC827_01020 [Cyanobacteria bacterium RM1_2_2]|nr:hypothetical protein [Cyanobacteria bacterium RM1_2_2]
MSASSINLKQRAFHTSILGFAILRQFILAFLAKVRMMFLYLRRNVITVLKDPEPLSQTRPKVLAILPHIVSPEEAADPRKAAAKVEKLKNAIDGLLTSFAHCELTILVSTLPRRHIVDFLPKYQKDSVQLLLEPDCDPMYVGFRVQDEFVKQINDFDWFLFIEDDIVLHDSLLLEKLERFNQNCGRPDAVLLPNRYEMWEGKKNYIDLTIDTRIAWNRLSLIEIEGIKYAECTNPHSAFYCLSQAQMKVWMQSGQSWKYQDVMVGPLESAATFCLLECFSLYKPHPANLYFLEVRHHDTKYSKLLPEPSPYTLSSVRG